MEEHMLIEGREVDAAQLYPFPASIYIMSYYWCPELVIKRIKRMYRFFFLAAKREKQRSRGLKRNTSIGPGREEVWEYRVSGT